MMPRKQKIHAISVLAYQCLSVMMTFVLTNLAWASQYPKVASSLAIIQIVPSHTWSDLKLTQDTINKLQTLTRAFRQSIRPTSAIRSSTNTIIFIGPDQVEKLAAAEAIALELKCSLLKVDTRQHIGETRRNLASVFHKAEIQGAILFFDEADALFGKRTDVSDSHDRYANSEIKNLVQLIKQYSGLIIINTQNTPQRYIKQITTNQTIIKFPCKLPCDFTHK
tara:strand:+ start:11855 stop:12523 length:669 start_codon:yes stop_codon:yes gene_type:complete